MNYSEILGAQMQLGGEIYTIINPNFNYNNQKSLNFSLINNKTYKFFRHQNFIGIESEYSEDELFKKDSTFTVVNFENINTIKCTNYDAYIFIKNDSIRFLEDISKSSEIEFFANPVTKIKFISLFDSTYKIVPAVNQYKNLCSITNKENKYLRHRFGKIIEEDLERNDEQLIKDSSFIPIINNNIIRFLVSNNNIANRYIGIDNNYDLCLNLLNRSVKFYNNNIYTENLHVCYILDQGYIIPTLTSIFSLIFNQNYKSYINIYLLTTNLIPTTKLLLSSLQDIFENVSIFIKEDDLSEFKTLTTKETSKLSATKVALLKFKIYELVPRIKKLLYLDGDTLITSSILDLFNTSIKDYAVGAVEDSGTLYSSNEIIRTVEKYFNSGCLLINLKYFRENRLKDKFISTKQSIVHNDLMDQHVLNLVLDKKVNYLPIQYNCLYVNLVRSFDKFNISELNSKYKTNFKTLIELKNQAIIIHFSSKDKPWKFWNIPLADLWYYYYQKMKSYLKSEEIVLNSRTFSSQCNVRKIEFQPEDRPRVVVSFTSIPNRINNTISIINNINNQSIKPDTCELWLSKRQFTKQRKELPKSLLELEEKNLVNINFVSDDLKAHKKYFYAMQQHPEKIIITIDDDLVYSRFLIERLLFNYKQFPNCVSASRVHLITGNKIDSMWKIKPYKEWIHEYNKWVGIPSHQLFATCGAGTLFPPHCLSNEVFNDISIKKFSLLADDLWLKIHMLSNDTQVVLCDPREALNVIEGTQEFALYKTNVINDQNDIQFNNLLNFYDKDNKLTELIFRYAPYPNAKINNNKKIEKQIQCLKGILNQDFSQLSDILSCYNINHEDYDFCKTLESIYKIVELRNNMRLL